jgi:hypothetical protein
MQFLPAYLYLERWQVERIPPVLDLEHAQQKAVHQEHDAAPDEHSELLLLGVDDAGNFNGERNGGEGEDAV